MTDYVEQRRDFKISTTDDRMIMFALSIGNRF